MNFKFFFFKVVSTNNNKEFFLLIILLFLQIRTPFLYNSHLEYFFYDLWEKKEKKIFFNHKINHSKENSNQVNSSMKLKHLQVYVDLEQYFPLQLCNY